MCITEAWKQESSLILVRRIIGKFDLEMMFLKTSRIYLLEKQFEETLFISELCNNKASFQVRKEFPRITIMAGNVVTGEMVEELILSGADIIKVGARACVCMFVFNGGGGGKGIIPPPEPTHLKLL